MGQNSRFFLPGLRPPPGVPRIQTRLVVLRFILACVLRSSLCVRGLVSSRGKIADYFFPTRLRDGVVQGSISLGGGPGPIRSVGARSPPPGPLGPDPRFVFCIPLSSPTPGGPFPPFNLLPLCAGEVVRGDDILSDRKARGSDHGAPSHPHSLTPSVSQSLTLTPSLPHSPTPVWSGPGPVWAWSGQGRGLGGPGSACRVGSQGGVAGTYKKID